MSTLTRERKRPQASDRATASRPDPDRPAINLGQVVITPLPRRNDDIYMRTVRRPRA